MKDDRDRLMIVGALNTVTLLLTALFDKGCYEPGDVEKYRNELEVYIEALHGEDDVAHDEMYEKYLELTDALVASAAARRSLHAQSADGCQ